MSPVAWLKKLGVALSAAQSRAVCYHDSMQKFVGAAMGAEGEWYPYVDIGHKNTIILPSGIIDINNTVYINKRKYY